MNIWVLIAGVLMLVSCTQQDVTDSASIAARSWCKSARNCTVHDPGS